MKKLASLLLALVMVFSLATTAFAADSTTEANTGSITVSNPLVGQTYTAYKIFDVAYDTNKTTYAYTISKTSKWYETVDSYASVANNGLTLTAAAGDAFTYVVTIDESKFSAANFAATLKTDAANVGDTGVTLTKADGATTASASGLALGYYFVTSTSGALCNLTNAAVTAVIRDKNDIPFEKTDDKADVQVGQTVNYDIKGSVPDTTGFTSYTYKVIDTMSEGLTFNASSVTVKLDGTEMGTDHYTLTQTTNGFELTIDVIELQDSVGKEILVEYSATVNEKAIVQVSTNKANLEYTNNPNGGTTSTPDDIETVYSAKIVIDKYKTGASTTKLAGAKFRLYKLVDTKNTPADTTDDTKEYYVATKVTTSGTEELTNVSWDTDATKATVVETDARGAASFEGLANGTYYLEETVAPVGYNLLTTPFEVTINGANAETIYASTLLNDEAKATQITAALTATANVENSAGTTLPETGGMGTTLFYIFGSILVIGAIVLLVTKKRMGEAQ